MLATAGGIVSNSETYALLLRRTHTIWIKARPDEHMSRVMEQGDFRPMAQNREAMADLDAILDARSADYARAEAELDTSGDTVEASFEKLQAIVSRYPAMTQLARPGLSRIGRHAARIPHDRAAPGRGADARAAARGARLGRGLGQLSGRACRRDRRRRLAYSRAGYGRSSPSRLPRSVAFMHEEAQDVLPRVLDAIGFRRGLLVGHSDGASIAAIYAGSIQDHRVRGLALMAPHFFTEDMGMAEIARAKVAFEQGNLRARLAKLHADPDNAFHNWCDPWLLPEFRQWDLTDALAHIRVPILIVQGENDQYGTVGRSRWRRRNATARSRSRCCRTPGTRPTARRRSDAARRSPTSPTGCCAITTKAISPLMTADELRKPWPRQSAN